MEKLYSDVDIRQKLGGKVKVLLYSELEDFGTIEEALGPHKAFCVLYEQEPQLGHWCCVFEGVGDDGNPAVCFFDPYGIMIDDELDDIDPRFRIASGEDFRYLSMLLGNSSLPIDYNQWQMQSDGKDAYGQYINTCGRWCVARITNRHLTTDEFAEAFTPEDKRVTPDEVIVAYTDEL